LEAHQGRWGREDWQALRDDLRRSEFWPLDPTAAAAVLTRLTAEWWNLRRWRESGQARRWVEAHQGRWHHDDWLGLLESLRASEFWPLQPASVGRALDEVKTEWLLSRRPSAYWPLDRDLVWQAAVGPRLPAREAA